MTRTTLRSAPGTNKPNRRLRAEPNTRNPACPISEGMGGAFLYNAIPCYDHAIVRRHRLLWATKKRSVRAAPRQLWPWHENRSKNDGKADRSPDICGHWGHSTPFEMCEIKASTSKLPVYFVPPRQWNPVRDRQRSTKYSARYAIPYSAEFYIPPNRQ